MRENCHKGLSEMVFENDFGYKTKGLLTKILDASIEPDLENRLLIEQNLDYPLKILPILSKWLSEHTSGARKLALEKLEKAYLARLRNDPLWSHYLGLCFHYITDWGTPYHSPVSIAKKVVPYSILGGIGIGLFKTLINWINNNGKIQEGVLDWSLLGAGATGATSLVLQYIKHNDFEKQCDVYWNKYKYMIKKYFNSSKIKYQIPSSYEGAFEKFNQLMYKLRNTCESTSPDWILADGNNFVDYMIKIAIVMDYAYKIVVFS